MSKITTIGTAGPGTLSVEGVGERDIVIIRSFEAPRQLVFDAHTKPELLRRWLGPRAWQLVVCEIDLRVGGAWRYEMHGPGGVVMIMHGTYLEVVAPERLVSTEQFDDNWTGGETTNTMALAEAAGVTTMTTTVRYPSADARAGALASGMAEGMAEGYGREMAQNVFGELRKMGGVRPPREFVFMDRAAIGLGSVFIHLRASINWHQLFESLIDGFDVDALTERQDAALKIAGLTS
jgi:uncharacterized protein YndB with AHSA1/START domain